MAGRIRAAVTALRTYIPEHRLDNEQLAHECGDWDASKVLEKTGIASRGIAAEGECASDLAVAAARRLFTDGVDPAGIDFLLFCTQSPDYFLPATACLIQQRLGLRTDCGALDFNQGCSGYVYGLSLAKGLIEGGVARRVLLLTGETYSKHLHPTDRAVRTIFGDGASATVIAAVDDDREWLGPFVLGTDGRGADQLIVRGGGFRNPEVAPHGDEPCAAGKSRSCAHLYMNGPEIFTFTLKAVPSVVRSLLEKASLGLDDIDFFVFHQANRFMLERLRDKLGIPAERFCINLETYGNTVSSTIPMALEMALASGDAKAGHRIMAVGFGVGYSWGACLLSLPGA